MIRPTVRALCVDTISEAILEYHDILNSSTKFSTQAIVAWHQLRRLGMWLPRFDVDEADPGGLPEMAVGQRLALTRVGTSVWR